jgi:hypothetical protein
MQNVKHLAKYFIILLLAVSCKTPSEYFNRPKVMMCIANGDGTMFCNGQVYNSANAICTLPEDYDTISEYYEDKEFRLYKCKRFGRCK